MNRIETVDKTVEDSLSKEYNIEKGTIKDIDELENLYNDLNDYLKLGANYPGWVKGIYPIRETAARGIQNNNLFVLRINTTIVGTIIVNHEPETAYAQVIWGIEADYKEVNVIHTLVVSPKYMNHGVGKKLMDFARTHSIKQKIKTIRLDVSIHNTPAIALYEKCGYKYLETVDLGLNIPGLVWFKVYEKVLQEKM